MVTAPEARPSSPAAAVSCQPDRDQSSRPVPLSIRFAQLARVGHYAGALYRRPNSY